MATNNTDSCQRSSELMAKFDKISDLFRASEKDFDDAYSHNTDRGMGIGEPVLTWKPPYCKCRDSKGNLVDGKNFGMYEKRVETHQGCWSSLTFYFDGDAPHPDERSSLAASALTEYRIQVLLLEYIDLVYIIRFLEEKSKLALFIKWDDDKLPGHLPDNALCSSGLLEAEENLTPHLVGNVEKEHRIPFKPAWHIFNPYERRGEMVDFVLPQSISDHDRLVFEFRIAHFLEPMTLDPYGLQPVWPSNEGWVDKYGHCTQGVQPPGTHVYRVVFWWRRETEEAHWTGKFGAGGKKWFGHRALLVSDSISSVQQQYVSVNGESLVELGYTEDWVPLEELSW